MKTELDPLELRHLESFGYDIKSNSLSGLIDAMPVAIRTECMLSDQEPLMLEMMLVTTALGSLHWMVTYRDEDDTYGSDAIVRPELIDALYHMAIIAYAKRYIRVV